MGANGTVGQSLGVIFSEFFNSGRPLHLIGRKNTSKGCAKFVNILKGQLEKKDRIAKMLR